MVGAGLLAALRGDLRPALARRVAPARRRGARPLLGRGARGVLRHGRGSRGARRPAAQPLRQRRAVRHVRRHRLAAAPGARSSARSGYEARRARGAPTHGRSDDALPVRLRPLPLARSTSTWARWPRLRSCGPRAGSGGLPLLARGVRPLSARIASWRARPRARGHRRRAAPRRARRRGWPADGLCLPSLRLPGAR